MRKCVNWYLHLGLWGPGPLTYGAHIAGECVVHQALSSHQSSTPLLFWVMRKWLPLVLTFGVLGPRAFDLWGPYHMWRFGTSCSTTTLKPDPKDPLNFEKTGTLVFTLGASGAQGLWLIGPIYPYDNIGPQDLPLHQNLAQAHIWLLRNGATLEFTFGPIGAMTFDLWGQDYHTALLGAKGYQCATYGLWGCCSLGASPVKM